MFYFRDRKSILVRTGTTVVCLRMEPVVYSASDPPPLPSHFSFPDLLFYCPPCLLCFLRSLWIVVLRVVTPCSLYVVTYVLAKRIVTAFSEDGGVTTQRP
jgi:hypothetical protein